MQDNENEMMEGIVSETSEEMVSEMEAAAAESQMEASSAVEKDGKLFTLRFKIPLEDYIRFYEIMSRDALPKNKRKSLLIGLVEVLVGAIYLYASLSGAIEGGALQYVLSAGLIIMGLYGMVYYPLFYKRAMQKAVARDYEKMAYLKNDIVVDFYPTKCVEHMGEASVEHQWQKIHSIRVSEQLYLFMLEPKRCLLVPKAQIPGQVEAVDAFIKEICDSFHKQRYEV